MTKTTHKGKKRKKQAWKAIRAMIKNEEGEEEGTN